MDAETAAEIRALSNGVRAVFIVLLVVPCLINALVALSIGRFESIYADMLGGKPLPAITMLVIHGRVLLLMLTGALPVGAVAIASLVRSHQTTFYSIGGLTIVAILQLLLTLAGLFLPLVSIISGMQAQS